MRRLFILFPFVAVLVFATPALAHTGFTPDEVGPDTIVDLTLNAADERDSAIITRVELFYPEGMTFDATAPDGPGTFTATISETGILWEGDNGEGDQQFTMTLGPMPSEPGRLQFKVLQTYANGDVDRWIEDWPQGAPEPDMPGPVLVVAPGGAGVPAPPTSAPLTTPTTLAPPTSEATTAPAPPTTAAPVVEADDGGNAPWLILGVIVVAVGAGVALFLSRRSR